ncbi:MAG: peptidylprolyl isomerase [Nitrospinales bacterium]
MQIHYTGKLQDNSVFDKSEGRPPLQFTLGSGQVIPGMDKAVTGMKVGESKTVSIPPEEAYGNYSEKMIFEVPTDKLPPGVKAGEKLMNPHGQRVTVKDIQGKTAHLDGNHFLAGKTLIFDIELMSINPPAGK